LQRKKNIKERLFMKLSKTMREEISSKIKNELLTKETKKIIEKEIGDDLRKLIEPEIVGGWEKYIKHILCKSSIYISYPPYEVPRYYPCAEYPNYGCNGEFQFQKLPENIKKKIQAYSDLIKSVNAAIEEIEKILLSCNTTKQLIDMIPEFEKYIKIDKSLNLPVPIEMINGVKNTLSSMKG
jgi:hypothetical protein